MDNKIKCLLAFVAGSTIGVGITWQFFKQKYKAYAQEEIDSVKEMYSKKHKSEPTEPETPKSIDFTDEEEMEYVSLVKEYKPDANDKIKKPYVISPDEFGEDIDREQISLTFYNDGVLTDENDEVIKNVDELIGVDSLNHFGEYEDDSVFVRDDRLNCEYEILLDQRNYSDVVKKKPRDTEE